MFLKIKMWVKYNRTIISSSASNLSGFDYIDNRQVFNGILQSAITAKLFFLFL